MREFMLADGELVRAVGVWRSADVESGDVRAGLVNTNDTPNVIPNFC
jgi:hypothetical protein